MTSNWSSENWSYFEPDTDESFGKPRLTISDSNEVLEKSKFRSAMVEDKKEKFDIHNQDVLRKLQFLSEEYDKPQKVGKKIDNVLDSILERGFSVESLKLTKVLVQNDLDSAQKDKISVICIDNTVMIEEEGDTKTMEQNTLADLVDLFEGRKLGDKHEMTFAAGKREPIGHVSKSGTISNGSVIFDGSDDSLKISDVKWRINK